MAAVTQEELDRIVTYLEGTCNTLYYAVELITDDRCEEEELTQDQFGYIDSKILCCARCGWWSESSGFEDIDSEDVCEDCVDG